MFRSHRPAWPLTLTLAGAIAFTVSAASSALAQPTDNLHAFMEATQHWLQGAVEATQDTARMPLRMEVVVGSLDQRLRLAPCRRIEPYIPTGTRLWGKTRLGLRCTEGTVAWNVFLPITIKALGPAWVLSHPVSAGTVITMEDVQEAEVDWAEDASPVISDAARWAGQVAARPLMAGQALRFSMVRPQQVFQPGAQLKVIAQGKGFSISTEGQALSIGVIGQTARVKIDSGKIMTCTVLDGRTVQIEI